MSSRRGAAVGALLSALVLALSLTACGSDDATVADAPTAPAATESEAGASASPSAAADAPSCEETWRAGSKLPRPYRGCLDEAGELVEPDRLPCSSGQVIMRQGDRWYAVPGGLIYEVADGLDNDEDYVAAVARCRA